MFSFIFNWIKSLFPKPKEETYKVTDDMTIKMADNSFEISTINSDYDNVHKLMYEIFEPMNRRRDYSGIFSFEPPRFRFFNVRGGRTSSEWNEDYNFGELNTPTGEGFNRSHPFVNKHYESSLFKNDQGNSYFFKESKKYEELT